MKYRSDSTLQMHVRKGVQGLQVQQKQQQSFGAGVTPGVSHIFPMLLLHLLSE